MRARSFISAVAVATVLIVGCSGKSDTSGSVDPGYETDLTLPTPTPGGKPPAGVQIFEGLSQEHVDTPVEYPQSPPVGGPHAFPPNWQTCKFYDSPVPNEQAVHSLEHGAVWITYSPDLPANQVALLRQLAGGHVLVSQYKGLTSPLVATAWGRQLPIQAATDVALVDFIAAFEEGPQTPELGAPCEGGTESLTLVVSK